jgi:predicted dehydrogenase
VGPLDQASREPGGRPRLGFLGVGWIGRARMEAIAKAGLADVVVVADADANAATEAAGEVGAAVVDPGRILFHEGLDGLVIATPSALHADQAIAAFDAGLSVFCQKPLARDSAETVAVVAAAARANRLLGVDLSYRHLEGTRRMLEVVSSGEIGDVYAADVTFHNAYGPDKRWFTDRSLSGGGCLIDLGTHLVDLVHLMLPGQRLHVVAADMFARGQRIDPAAGPVEDHAVATLRSSAGASVRLACSWFTHAGRDALIEATFHGTDGSVQLNNVDGSFYDFESWLCRGTKRERLSAPPDSWGGRAAVAWTRQLGLPEHEREPQALDEFVALAEVIDEIYGR